MKQLNITNRMRFWIPIILFFINSVVSAAIIVVDRDDDLPIAGDGGCSLRDAINSANINFALEDCAAGDANTMDTIIINVAGPIQLNSQIDIISSMSITPNLNAPQVTIIAAENSRILSVHPLTITDDDFQMGKLRLINGNAGVENGGAILFDDYQGYNSSFPVISLVNIEFENNYAEIGGAIFINNVQAESFSITQSKFISNTAFSAPGISASGATDSNNTLAVFELNDNLFQSNIASAPAIDTRSGAVLIETDNLLNIRNNLFLNNTTNGQGGALSLYDTIVGRPSVEFANNLFLNNQAGGFGGAIYLRGVIANMTNNTLAFNSADIGGGIHARGSSEIKMRNSTLVYNQGISQGANIATNNSVEFGNSIVAYPVGANNCEIDPLRVSSIGANISDDGSCELNHVNDLIADPQLSGLVYHASGLSGFIPTADSPALDSSLTADCLDINGVTIIDFDQQGNPRTTDGDNDGNAYCDSGAIEAPANTDLIWADSFGV